MIYAGFMTNSVSKTFCYEIGYCVAFIAKTRYLLTENESTLLKTMCKYCSKNKEEGYSYCPHCGRRLVKHKDISFGAFLFCLLVYPFFGFRVLLAKFFASKDSELYKSAQKSFGVFRRTLRRYLGLPV